MAFSPINEDDEWGDALEIFSDAKSDKFNRILESEENGSLWELREMALTRGGLMSAALRQRVWPLLVGLPHDESWMNEAAQLFEPSAEIYSELEDRERDLIRRDVVRSVLFHHSCPSPNSVMGSFDGGPIESKAELSTSKLAAVLTATIAAPLAPNDDKPHYYQGLHDLGGVLLENLDYDEVLTTGILRRLCLTHLRDNTAATFDDLKWFLDSCLMKVLSMVDPPVYHAVVESGLDGLLPSTLVKWLFTWFTHSIHGEEQASRLVDAFMASHPLLPFYVSIAFLVHPRLRTDVLSAEWDDPSSVNMAIQNLPSQIKSDWKSDDDLSCVTTQDLIETAICIMEKVPPKALLQLVDDPERASNMTLMKSLTSLDSGSTTNPCTRAKMASGVPVLMAQHSSIEWLKHFGPPAVVQPKVQRPANLKTRLRLFSASIIKRLPKNKLNRVALAYGIFVVSYALCKLFYELYFLFSTGFNAVDQLFRALVK